jgi:hypothetical protein
VDLCKAYGSAVPALINGFQRYRQGGVIGIKELSAPRSHLNATTEEACEMIIQTKLYRRSWGPKKVLALFV